MISLSLYRQKRFTIFLCNVFASLVMIGNASAQSYENYATCQRQYVEGEYQCSQFSRDFVEEAASNGITAWPLTVQCPGGNGHGVNIVFYSPSSENNQTVFNRYCVIDPQGGANIGCWYENHSNPRPTSVPQSTLDLVMNYECPLETRAGRVTKFTGLETVESIRLKTLSW